MTRVRSLQSRYDYDLSMLRKATDIPKGKEDCEGKVEARQEGNLVNVS